MQIQRYKQTELGEIPEEWKIFSLQDLISNIQSGIWGENPGMSKNIFPVLRSTDILPNGNIVFETAALREIPLEKVSKYELKDCDILIVSSSGSSHLLGRPAFFLKPKIDQKFVFSNFLIRITSNNLVTPKYLYYLLNSKYYQQFLVKIQETTSGLRNLLKSNLLGNLFPIPSLIEQKKIASILSNMDNLIQKNDKIIEQTQRLKKGLMQRLLTKGIGYTKFKKTVLGEIPEEWTIETLSKLSNKIIDMEHKMPNKTKDGIPFISVAYLTKDDSLFMSLRREDPSLEFISIGDFSYHSKRFNVEYGDLLISRYGTIGVTKVIDTKEKFLASYSIALIKPIKDIINPVFLGYLLNSQIIKKQIIFLITQSSNTNLGVLDIKKIILYIPSIKEQQKIASILSNVDNLIQNLKKDKKIIQDIKNGLMQQLLTGKIRVKV